MAREDRAVASALLTLDDVTHRLRRECPWDREQDERSIVPHTIEEAYELADAAHSGDDAKLVDELGDVLFQVYFLALLLEERDHGDLETVARAVTEKLIRRHPHIFEPDGGLEELPTDAHTPAQVKENWDAIKQRERRGRDALAGIAETLPALLYARKVQRRVAAGGTERTLPEESLTRINEALEGLSGRVAEEPPVLEDRERRHGSEALYERLGELLFAVVELSGSLQVDPEIALRKTADRYRLEASGT